MCSYSYVLLHTKIVFIPAKSNILPHHISHHLREITWHFIWLHSVNNWDRGLVHCGANNLRGCWLFGQNEIQVYCRASSTIVVGNRHRGEKWRLAIWLDYSALNWDCGLVDCGTNILRGCWLFRQNEIQVYCGASSTIIAGNRQRAEEWCLAIWFDC